MFRASQLRADHSKESRWRVRPHLEVLEDRCLLSATIIEYYRFEEGGGTVLHDSISGQAQGTTNAIFTTNVPIKSIPQTGAANNYSLALINPSAGDMSASFTSDFILNRDHPDATLQFWIKAPSQTNASVFWTTSNNDVGNGTDADNRFNILLGPSAIPGDVDLGVDYREPGNFNAIHILTPGSLHLVANIWTNVVITRTGGDFYSYYINGQLVETYTDLNANLPTANSASNPWTIGGRPPGGLNADLSGEIDEVAFSNQALAPDQFLYSPQTVKPAPPHQPPLPPLPSPPSPPAPPVLNVPPLLSFLDSLFAGTETVNANGTETITDNFFGIPLIVSTFDSHGDLMSVDLFGFTIPNWVWFV